MLNYHVFEPDQHVDQRLTLSLVLLVPNHRTELQLQQEVVVLLPEVVFLVLKRQLQQELKLAVNEVQTFVRCDVETDYRLFVNLSLF